MPHDLNQQPAPTINSERFEMRVTPCTVGLPASASPTPATPRELLVSGSTDIEYDLNCMVFTCFHHLLAHVRGDFLELQTLSSSGIALISVQSWTRCAKTPLGGRMAAQPATWQALEFLEPSR